MKSCASSYAKAYVPIVRRHYLQNFTERQKQWQQIRRGRYVEFNLVYDRGTKFGLMKPGARFVGLLFFFLEFCFLLLVCLLGLKVF